jgi:nucleotide-binding universal stress UspA family protein
MRSRAVDALVEAGSVVDLVVVGRHGHRALREAHVGAVARAVMRESKAPVEVVPSNWLEGAV